MTEDQLGAVLGWAFFFGLPALCAIALALYVVGIVLDFGTPWRSITHRLFGWDWVHLENTATEIVRRVRTTGGGERYVRYFHGHLVFIDRPGCGWTVSELTRPFSASDAVITFPARRSASNRRGRP